jgi:urease accessory protein
MSMGLAAMSTDLSPLLLLLNWMSPTFPIGSFAYSHGLEQAIADDRLTSREAVQAWISDLLQHGSLWNDAVLFSACWTQDAQHLNATALALAGSSERHMETTHLGRNFAIAATVWTGTDLWAGDVAYPVVAGSACRTMAVPREQAIAAFLQGSCAALVSVAVRLVPLGQTQGLIAMKHLATTIEALVPRLTQTTLDDLGGCCVAAEVAAMQHETLEPRIFRT